MAEVCSVYPTAGGLYWWAYAVARTNKAAWAWFIGWFNFLGQVAVTAAIDFGAALTTTAFLALVFDFPVSKGSTFGVFAVIILLHGLLNTFGVNLVKLLSDVSAWWHLVGVAFIVGVLAVVPDHHYPVSKVFLQTANASGLHGAGAAMYAFILGLLMAQYTFTGYDASAHLSEETHQAARSAPRGIVMSVVVSLVAGFFLLFAVTWAIQNYSGELGSATGFPPAQIFIDATGRHMGEILLLICVVAQFFCGMASVTANSRMAYAFSRDGALPGSRFWSRVNLRTGTPTNSIWLCVVCSIILVLPALWNSTAYAAATAIAVIGLYVAYVMPVYPAVARSRLRGRARGISAGGASWSGWTAVVWVAIICVMFVLPSSYPITVKGFNYTIVAVAVVLGAASLWWVLSARRTGSPARGRTSSPEHRRRRHDRRGKRRGSRTGHGRSTGRRAGRISGEAARRSSAAGKSARARTGGRRAGVRDRQEGERDAWTGRSTSTLWRPVRGGNAFEITVARLAQAIRLGMVGVGDQLPPERELAERLQVSRVTLREAIAALRDAGYLETRRGRSGGTFVRVPGRHRGAERGRPAAARSPGRWARPCTTRSTSAGSSSRGRRRWRRAVPCPPPIGRTWSACLAARGTAAAPTRRVADSRLHLAIAAASGSPSLAAAVADVQIDVDRLLAAIPVIAAQPRPLRRPAPPHRRGDPGR